MERTLIYQWKIASFAKGLDADEAIKELEAITRKHGALTPARVVEEASIPTSFLHSLFEWDDSKAAEKYRLQQARTIINNVDVKIVSNGETYVVSAYEIVSTKGEENQYKRIDILTYDEKEQVKKSILEAIKQLTQKLRLYKEWERIVELFQEAERLLSE